MEHIEVLLKEKGVRFIYQGQDIVVSCLNPEHEDANPSMRIDKQDGKFQCFSCGFKGNIFSYYGILTNNTSVRIAKLKEKLKNLRLDLDGLEYPEGYTPVTTTFRTISKQTLQLFDAFYTDRVEELADRIVFPIKDASNKITVFVARHTLSDAQPKYVVYPKNRPVPTYPVIMEKGTKSIVLVEGIFDALNCYDKGMHNVVCVFGTNTLQASTRSKLLPYKIQGVTKVFILFDGDTAGVAAANKLKPLIEECDLEVEILTLPEGVDPGQLDKEYVNTIKEYTQL